MKELIIEDITWRRDYVKEMMKFQITGRMPTKKPHFIKLMAPANLDESRQRQYVMQYLNMHYGECPTNFTIRKF
jgi:hypothetical protein